MISVNSLWVERYRPTTIDEYVFSDEKQKNILLSIIKEQELPHLLLSGGAGVGKTTIAKVLLNEIGVDWGDVLQINASENNGVDYIKDNVINFVSSMPFGKYKYVLLDEADYLSHNAQAILRGVTETFSNTARFILTCNYPHKIIVPLKSRCQHIHIETLDKTEFTVRIAEILLKEQIQFEEDTLDLYVDSYYPDMRKCINTCQLNSKEKVLIKPDKKSNEKDYRLEVVSLFRSKKYKEARTLICKQIQAEEYEEFYRFMYNNLDFWADTQDKENQAIILIRDGLYKHGSCADSEINLSATLIQLEQLSTP